MTNYARVADGLVAEIIHVDASVDIADCYHPSIVTTLVRLVGGQNGTVQQGWTYDDGKFTAPVAPPVPDLPARTYKADIWRRCTAVEADQLDAALDQAPAKLRRLWDDSQVIMHEADEFPALRGSVAAIVGDARADQLLAPSYFGG